jgi:hypothetical protein
MQLKMLCKNPIQDVVVSIASKYVPLMIASDDAIEKHATKDVSV